MLELAAPQPGRPRPRAGVRSRRRRPGRGAAGRPGRRGRAVRRRAGDDVDRRGPRRGDSGLDQRAARRVLDLEEIDEPDGVVRRRGVPRGPDVRTDPARAAREIRRGAATRRRVALAVWGPRERNPWLGVVFDAVSAQLGMPVPPPGVPGPFSLDDAAGLTQHPFRRGAWRASSSTSSATPYAGSFEEWWTRTSALAGPIARTCSRRCPRKPAAPSTPACARSSALRDTHRPGVPRREPHRLRLPRASATDG